MGVLESLNTLVLVAVVALIVNMLNPGNLTIGTFNFNMFITATLALAVVYAFLQSVDGILSLVRGWIGK